MSKQYQDFVIPTFNKYLMIPGLSPNFDPKWKENQFLDKTVDFCIQSIKDLNLKNCNTQKIQLDNVPPALYVQIGSKLTQSVFVYGSLDKQDTMKEEWTEQFSPFDPKVVDDCLYGRGSAGGPWGLFSLLGVFKAMQDLKIELPLMQILFESQKYSGSTNLVFVIKSIKYLIKPDYIFCLDSSCFDYDNLYVQTSTKGLLEFDLTTKMMSKGYHSGLGSGLIGDPFRVMMNLMDHLEDRKHGQLTFDFKVDIPPEQYDFMQSFIDNKKDDLKWNF